MRRSKKSWGFAISSLQQIVYVVGVIWVGTAAKLGHSQVVFWLAAMLFFYLPQAAVVIHLTKRMPLEGGLYQWARLGLGELTGFLVAWNLWVYAVVLDLDDRARDRNEPVVCRGAERRVVGERQDVHSVAQRVHAGGIDGARRRRTRRGQSGCTMRAA